MRWLITGGCGFIGTNLIAHLQKTGEVKPTIRVLDDLSASTRDDLRDTCVFCETPAGEITRMSEPGVELVVGDIRNAELALRSVQGADAVVHLAACTGVLPSVENPRFDCETNVLGTFNYLEAARRAGCVSFTLASSGAPLGEQDPPIHEEKVPRPISPYGASKLCGEAYCSAFHGSYGLRTIALRFGNVYGPRSHHKNSVVAKFTRRAFEGETLFIYGDGGQTRDFIFIDDIVNAIVKSVESGVGGEVFQIATHRETTVGELAEMLVGTIKEKTGVEAPVEHSEPMAGEVRRNFSDVAKAKRLLGWEPKTELREGLSRTVDWFIEHYYPGSSQG